VEPYLLDARRCISYLTIEHPGPVDPSLRRAIGPWIFGCDRCQQVCPHNARAPLRVTPDPQLAPADGLVTLELSELLRLRSGAYRRLVAGRALRRTPRSRLQRNAALAAGALLAATTAPAIRQALEEAAGSPDPSVSEAALWALEQA